jgi:hypothetical protein
LKQQWEWLQERPAPIQQKVQGIVYLCSFYWWLKKWERPAPIQPRKKGIVFYALSVGGLTNGSGLLQFSRGFTKFAPPGTSVVPVALRTHTPFGLRTHTLTSSFAQNLFFYRCGV